MVDIIQNLESRVRSYSRKFPAVFDRAQGCVMYDVAGREYVDFFSGAGALNYGHNHPRMKRRLLDYVAHDGLTHSLDMTSSSKRRFLERFLSVILRPRALDYKVQFPGPTGTNAVEAALKLARKVTGREKIISFTNAFHGMTLGSLSVSGNAFKRAGAGVPLTMTDTMPYSDYFGPDTDTIEYMDRLLSDRGSGIDLPAAVIVETLQAEGGINVATDEWLVRLAHLCRRYGMLLIVDDIQVGCGRTGPFFSFEPAGIEPDIVCLSKSISGYGLPMAITLIKPEWDKWEPGEHNGTFRGHNLAFVTACEALTFWESDALTRKVQEDEPVVRRFLEAIRTRYPQCFPDVRGRGLIQGLVCAEGSQASQICAVAFEHGLVMETSGPEDNVVKLIPPLTIEADILERGLGLLEQSIEAVLGEPEYEPHMVVT